MKNNFKRIAAGLCALTMIPCLSVYAENASSIMSAKAGSSFIVNVNDENNDIEFDERQINVDITPIQEASATNVSISVNSYKEINCEFSGLEYINKISFKIQATNTSLDYLKENAEISGRSSISKDGKEYSASFWGAVFECEEIGKDTYLLHFCTGINGDSYSFNITGLNEVDNLKVISYEIGNEAAYKVEATCPDGEGICAYLPASEGLNNANMTKWANNQCLLANSLKHLTGIQGYDIVYYYFDGSIAYADASSISWNNSEIRSGRIRFNPDATKDELDLIELNSNNYNFFTMHELGHVYGFNSKFRTVFGFDTYDEEGKASGNDEYYTNVRALTALQNCENIKNHQVRKTDMRTGNSDKMYPFSYDEVYEVDFDYKSISDYYYHIARGFIKACDLNWNKLETFYKAEIAPIYNSEETIDATDKLVDRLGITIEGYNSNGAKKKSILHFVNMLRWLYIVSTGMDYNEGNFINFIDETFAIEGTDVTGLDCITKMLVKEKICSPIILKKKPQSAIAPMGSEVKTKVEAEGEGLSYQWYLCEPGGDEFKKSSVTGKSYSYTMTDAKDGRKVYCEITDKDGNTVTTDTVTLGTVVITEQPSHIYAPIGGSVKTSVKALGNNLSYQWYVKNPGKNAFSKSSITKAVYECPMTEDRDGREIYCIISDDDGNFVKSDIVTLGTIVITEQPKSAVTEGSKAACASIVAEGEGLSYKWYTRKIGEEQFTPNKKSDKISYFSFSNTIEAYCEVTDIHNKTVKSDVITLGPPLGITEDLVDITAKFGEKVSFSVSAIGPGLTYKWYYKNKDMKAFNVTNTFKTNTYSFDKITKERAGREVYCVITDIFGNSVQTKTIKIDLPTGYGDANCDGELTIDDADAIMKAYANPSRYGLTEQGMINADVSGEGDVTLSDALLIQQYFAN